MMKQTLTAALAIAAAVTSCAATSRADETAPPVTTATSTATTTTTTTATQATTIPAQPGSQPAQVSPQPQPLGVAPVQVQPPPARSMTTTTAATYSPSGERHESTTDRRANRALLWTGSGTFMLSYGASVIAGAVSGRDEDKKLFIPLVGPWIDLSERNCDARDCGSREGVNKALIATSGVFQSIGVLFAVGSLIIPERTESMRVSAPTKPGVRVVPLSYRAGAGIGAIGSF